MTAFTFVEQMNGSMAMVCLDNVAYIEKLSETRLRIHYIGQTGYMDTDTTLNQVYGGMFTVENVVQAMAQRQENTEETEDSIQQAVNDLERSVEVEGENLEQAE